MSYYVAEGEYATGRIRLRQGRTYRLTDEERDLILRDAGSDIVRPVTDEEQAAIVAVADAVKAATGQTWEPPGPEPVGPRTNP